jgi:hypothetical protein
MSKKQKPKKRMAALRAAILFLGFAFVLTQSTAAVKAQNGVAILCFCINLIYGM